FRTAGRPVDRPAAAVAHPARRSGAATASFHLVRSPLRLPPPAFTQASGASLRSSGRFGLSLVLCRKRRRVAALPFRAVHRVEPEDGVGDWCRFRLEILI